MDDADICEDELEPDNPAKDEVEALEGKESEVAVPVSVNCEGLIVLNVPDVEDCDVPIVPLALPDTILDAVPLPVTGPCVPVTGMLPPLLDVPDVVALVVTADCVKLTVAPKLLDGLSDVPRVVLDKLKVTAVDLG